MQDPMTDLTGLTLYSFTIFCIFLLNFYTSQRYPNSLPENINLDELRLSLTEVYIYRTIRKYWNPVFHLTVSFCSFTLYEIHSFNAIDHDSFNWSGANSAGAR